MSRLAVLLAACVLGSTLALDAQRGAGGKPTTPRQAAPIDLTGSWVSVVIEDWEYRMVVPNKGVIDALPLNPEGRKIAEAWDPARDEKAGEQCKAYGAPALMRLPTRLRVAWQDDSTLRVETDYGTQTRLLRFGAAAPPAGEATWQGHSRAEWNVPGRNLKVVTTNLRPGYVRKNGAPYSDRTVLTEYVDLHSLPNGDQWMTITTRIEDPVYYTRPFITSTDFKKLPKDTGWNPTPCSVK